MLQNAPRGDVVLVRLYEEISRENVRSECGGKGGFPCTHVHIQVTHDIHLRLPPASLSLSLPPALPPAPLPLSLPLLRLPLSGWWCGKSVVLTGTRWSTTLKAVVAVKEEGCRLEGKRWVDRVHEEEGVVWSYGTTMYLICRPLYGLGYSWWSGDGVLVGAWCTATKGGGVVVWWCGVGARYWSKPTLAPTPAASPPHPLASSNPTATPRHPLLPLHLPCLLPRLSRAQPVTLTREYFDRYFVHCKLHCRYTISYPRWNNFPNKAVL